MRSIGQASLYLVADARALERVLEPALAEGVDLVQLRDKDAGEEELLRTGAWALGRCAGAQVPFLLNDRPDLARRLGSDGVHVGQDDAPVQAAREAVGPTGIVGLSTHRREQLAAAGSSGADYASVGPVHPTPTKAGRPAAGLDYVRHAAEHATLPWFAIGGIDLETLPAVLDAGATRVVVVRAIADAPDPAAAARALRLALDGAAVA